MTGQLLQKDDVLLQAMVQDAVQLCDRRGKPAFVGFLDEREQSLIRKLMEREKIENYMLWGGYDGAERVVFGAFSVYDTVAAEDFPLCPVTFLYRVQDSLSHRDFLGALMALGIERSTVGDLLVEPGRCVAFLRKEILPYVLSQITKVGAVGVRVMEGAEAPYPEGRRFLPISAVVSSLRTDCIAAACTGDSRERVKTWITAGSVTVNDQVCVSPSSLMAEGDKIAIRGKGKFRLEHIGGLTRKGRIGVGIKKYL